MLRERMSQPAADHRRATAERNFAAILDATERLLARRITLNMAAIATEAGLSRVTVYAHFKTLSHVVEAAIERAVNASLAAIEAAELDTGPADEALRRMISASWDRLASGEALARAAAEHLSTEHLSRTHEPLMAHLRKLLKRGQGEGVFRTDLPAEWLVTTFYALVHGAHDHARTNGIERPEALQMLTATMSELFTAR